MEVLCAILAIFTIGYAAGTAVARYQIRSSTSPRKCKDCRYCYEITAGTKRLIHKDYRDKWVCIMHRGSSIPVGDTGHTISVVSKDSYCDQWKEQDADG